MILLDKATSAASFTANVNAKTAGIMAESLGDRLQESALAMGER